MRIKYFNLCEDSLESCKYVETGEILISEDKLFTSKVGTCSILMFSIGEKNIMAHIDAGITKVEYLLSEIKNIFNDDEIKSIKEVFLILGPWCEDICYNDNLKCKCESIRIAKETLKNLNLLKKLKILEKNEASMKWETEVWFNGEIKIK